jgi:hypothetical protein
MVCILEDRHMLRFTLVIWQILLGMMFCIGCGVQSTILETGDHYFFTANDALVLPGQETALQAQFRSGDFLQPQAGYCVRFYHQGKLYKAALTDDAGLAAVRFQADAPGDYLFQAALAPVGLEEAPPEPVECMVTCRSADEPMMIVDLDKTVVASGFQAVLMGGAEPMPGAAEVLGELGRNHTIVYLTHRPDLFGPKSKAWLQEHGFPPGPLLLSTLQTFAKGSGAYKTRRLEDIRARFSRVETGIGDKISDALAYHENGMQAFLILPIPDELTPAGRDGLVEQLRPLPDTIQVVQDWSQIAAFFEKNQRYPAARTIDLLQQQLVREGGS